MKKNFSFLVMFFALSVFAQQRIGYIDSQKILASYSRAQEIRSEFDNQVKEWKNEINRRQQELERLQKNLQSQSFMLTEEARLRKIEELQKKKVELETYVGGIYGKDGKAESLNQELMQPLLAEIDTVVSEIAEEEEFSYILDASTGVVIYADDIYDITDRIIETLNRKHMPGITGEEIEYYVFQFKDVDSDSKSMNLGSRIKMLILTGLRDLGGSFEIIESVDLSNATTSLAIDNEEDVSEDTDLAVQFLNISDIDFVIIGKVRVETGNIFFEYSIVDKEDSKAVVTNEVDVGVEDNLTESIEEVITQVAALYK
jgi:outer membrane protein